MNEAGNERREGVLVSNKNGKNKMAEEEEEKE